MAQDYKIKAVGQKINDWDSAYGPMKTYLIQVEGNGEPVQLNKKAESPPPKVGDDLYGDIEDSQWGQKFKSAKKPFAANSTGGSSGSSGYSRDDAAIKAQFAIKAAIAYHQSDVELSTIEETAKDIYLMVERVKAAQQTPSLREKWDKLQEPQESGDMPEDLK